MEHDDRRLLILPNNQFEPTSRGKEAIHTVTDAYPAPTDTELHPIIHLFTLLNIPSGVNHYKCCIQQRVTPSHAS